MGTRQARTPRRKLIETRAGPSEASSQGPELIKGTSGVAHAHVAGAALISHRRSHIPPPDVLYKKVAGALLPYEVHS